MHRWRVTWVAAVAIAGAAMLPAGPADAAVTWTVTPAAPVAGGGGFAGVDAVSSTDAWAVGGQTAERWNGTRWSKAALPDLVSDHSNPNNFALLQDVDALSGSAAFAVGTYGFFGPVSGTAAVVVRWNGSSWSKATVPNPDGSDYSLYGVKALSSGDAWAVGRTVPTTLGQTLALHWNGSTWSKVATPSPGTQQNYLYAVDGTSGSDVWAVGYSRNLPYGNRARSSLILHWNGVAWAQVPSPNLDTQTVLEDVVAVSATDAWAVGYTSGAALGQVVMHWNGTAWAAVAPPGPGVLSSVTALSPSDVWVAGTDAAGAPLLADRTPAGWTTAAVPRPAGSASAQLEGLAALAPGTVWAVGSATDGAGLSQPLAVRTTSG